MGSAKKAPTDSNQGPVTWWEFTAIAAACLALLAPFLYQYRQSLAPAPPESSALTFSGTASCKACHADIYKKWQGSDHDRAMAEATEENVRGDFNEVTFTDPYTGITSRFFREGPYFKVETEGPDGTIGIFTITHTFGHYPLQQYLVPFPGGRLQCLAIAWDVDKRTWYRLPPYEVAGPTDWLHWTKGGQNWNSMCAECHSTQLQKGYDLQKNEYTTSWFEINVGCEACHGPASGHLVWAKVPPLARRNTENYGLIVQSSSPSPEKQIGVCAPCHSRRYQLADNNHDTEQLLDLMVPSLLTEALYHPDGQIKEEVYVFGSYTQSKMYHRGVRCSDCHDMHTLKTFSDAGKGNQLCLQCHRASDYDTEQHHFHKTVYQGKPSNGYLCVSCHMPGQLYMGIDYRPDHSLRVPRPDLSKKLNTPNGCSANGCHSDKSIDWLIEGYDKWYGLKRKPHFGEIFSAARAAQDGQGENLRQLAADNLLPTIVRSTALSLLGNYPAPDNIDSFVKALASDEALLRHTALSVMDQPSVATLLKFVAPKLYDPVKAVRLEAAIKLAALPPERLEQDDRAALKGALQEYQTAMKYNGDFPAQRYNLGNLARMQGSTEEAIGYYRQALDIDEQFYPAKINLAMAYNQLGQNAEAEKLMRQVLDQSPQLYEVSYSLGLLLAEENRYEEAAKQLAIAADGMPGYSRVRYNQALALLKLKKWQEAAAVLTTAIRQEPTVEEYFTTLAELYLNFKMYDQARKLAETVIDLVPEHGAARKLLEAMEGRSR